MVDDVEVEIAGEGKLKKLDQTTKQRTGQRRRGGNEGTDALRQSHISSNY